MTQRLHEYRASASGTARGMGLPALERRLKQDLEWLDLPAKPWLTPKTIAGQPVRDVAIIGGGMAGLAEAVALGHLGISVGVYDQAPEGYEGPWATIARMETLRSPKQLTGPALGLPALTFRAWFEAQFGLAAWNALDKIPRLQWMDYLRWYRKVMAVEVHNQHHVTRIEPHADHVAIHIDAPGDTQHVLVRHLVLATGRAGLGGPHIPAFVDGLDRSLWAHSSDVMDYGRLRGQRVLVVGAGASAMDSAATALESGAASVTMLVRRTQLPRVNKGKGVGSAGFTQGYRDLPDAWKWRIRHYINQQQVPPPHHSVLRVSRHANAFLHLGTPVLAVTQAGRVVQVKTPQRTFEADFLILGTGFQVDWPARPEFATFAAHVRTWGDRFHAANEEQDAELDASPDLGPAFEFQEKAGHPLPGLARIHCLCYPATLSHGTVSGDIPAVSDGASRLARALASRLFQEDIAHQFEKLQTFDEPELLGDEWTPASASSANAADATS